jgi:hypothetical protein
MIMQKYDRVVHYRHEFNGLCFQNQITFSLFYGSFNDIVSSRDYTASNGSMVGK